MSDAAKLADYAALLHGNSVELAVWKQRRVMAVVVHVGCGRNSTAFDHADAFLPATAAVR